MLKIGLLNLSMRVTGVVLSGILLSSIHPPRELSWAAWVALIPFFVILFGQRPLYSFFLSYLCGLVFFPGIFNWIFQVSGYSWLHHVLLDFYLGAYFALFGVMYAFISRRLGVTPALVAAPFIWVCLEYVRSNLSFLSLPWALLAHSQYLNPVMIQTASFAGTYGVSFLIVLANSAAAMVILYFLSINNIIVHQEISWHKLLLLTGITASMIGLAALFGIHAIGRPMKGPRIKISVVQGNIEQRQKWDPKLAQLIMQTYADLTQHAAQANPDLIIWPETATPAAIRGNRDLYQQVVQITKTSGTHLLLGSSEYPKIYKRGAGQLKYRNSALLFLPSGKAAPQYYDKILLMPFGEFLPYEDILPWSWLNVTRRSNFLPGRKFTVFKLGEYRFGTTICWENIFPAPPRKYAQKGAHFIVNLVNEAWFGDTAAPRQFLSISVFRAIENRRYVVRCANTGISCFINPYGVIEKRVRNKEGKDTFVSGVATETVVPMVSTTVYTQYGDWFVALCIGVSACLLARAIWMARFKRKRNS